MNTSIKTKQKGYLVNTTYVDNLLADNSPKEVVVSISQPDNNTPSLKILKSSISGLEPIIDHKDPGRFRLIFNYPIFEECYIENKEIIVMQDSLDGYTYVWTNIVDDFQLDLSVGSSGSPGDGYLTKAYILKINILN